MSQRRKHRPRHLLEDAFATDTQLRKRVLDTQCRRTTPAIDGRRYRRRREQSGRIARFELSHQHPASFVSARVGRLRRAPADTSARRPTPRPLVDSDGSPGGGRPASAPARRERHKRHCRKSGYFSRPPAPSVMGSLAKVSDVGATST
jgi:hypothetical protein